MSFGFGPQITAPTATEDALGTEKWSAGLVNVLFDASSPKFQYGYLASWQHSFAGEDNRSDVNLGTFQPFLFYQLGGGTYVSAVTNALILLMISEVSIETYSITPNQIMLLLSKP